MSTSRDWRENYVVCEHVAADANVEARHRKFRVCCEACYGILDAKGAPEFLFTEELVTEQRPDGLCVGRLPEH